MSSVFVCLNTDTASVWYNLKKGRWTLSRPLAGELLLRLSTLESMGSLGVFRIGGAPSARTTGTSAAPA